MSPTVSWKDFEQAEPQFAGRVQALFDAPAQDDRDLAGRRVTAHQRIETEFADGELRFGSMIGARKGTDLRRDPRFALHCASDDPVEGHERLWPGDAKIAGRAVAAGPIAAGPQGDLFHAGIAEVVLTHLDDGAAKLIIEYWTPAGGLRQIERE